MVSFGISKHEHVKQLQSFLVAIPPKLALFAKGTMHDDACPCFLFAFGLCGGTAILFGKVWIALGLVRLGNVYGFSLTGIL